MAFVSLSRGNSDLGREVAVGLSRDTGGAMVGSGAGGGMSQLSRDVLGID